ncbi:hypothetical protein FH972_018457 [Carpinus fangiana]|uniref:Uncharacterized protein n=1 Tax=Carpinus fangiana TaxID=176857 RepID=A0A5N6RMD1_9ROSI|nr:hypothetical protein FH972_018457 [Carpinus fangiana]
MKRLTDIKNKASVRAAQLNQSMMEIIPPKGWSRASIIMHLYFVICCGKEHLNARKVMRGRKAKAREKIREHSFPAKVAITDFD